LRSTAEIALFHVTVVPHNRESTTGQSIQFIQYLIFQLDTFEGVRPIFLTIPIFLEAIQNPFDVCVVTSEHALPHDLDFPATFLKLLNNPLVPQQVSMELALPVTGISLW
jgi:hypothetical protein